MDSFIDSAVKNAFMKCFRERCQSLLTRLLVVAIPLTTFFLSLSLSLYMSFKNAWHWMTCLPMLGKFTGTSFSQEGIRSEWRKWLKLYFLRNALWTDQCDLMSVLWSPRLSLKPPNIYSSTNTAPRRAKVTPLRRSNANETLLSKQMWCFCIYTTEH